MVPGEWAYVSVDPGFVIRVGGVVAAPGALPRCLHFISDGDHPDAGVLNLRLEASHPASLGVGSGLAQVFVRLGDCALRWIASAMRLPRRAARNAPTGPG